MEANDKKFVNKLVKIKGLEKLNRNDINNIIKEMKKVERKSKCN